MKRKTAVAKTHPLRNLGIHAYTKSGKIAKTKISRIAKSMSSLGKSKRSKSYV